MTKNSKRAFYFHCWFLFAISVSMTVISFIGFRSGIGPGVWLQAHPVAMVGMIQAYLLMAFVALLILSLARLRLAPKLRFLLVAAHCVPLFAIVTLYDIFQAQDLLHILPKSLSIHLPWIAVEMGFYLYDLRSIENPQ